MKLLNNKIGHVNVDNFLRAAQYGQEEGIYDNSQHRFFLEGNPFVCDCQSLQFLNYLRSSTRSAIFEDKNKYYCSEPQSLAKRQMIKVNPEELTCNLTLNCPENCTCLYRAANASTEVFCSGALYSEIPQILPENISILAIDKNNIEHISNISNLE